MHTQDIRTIQTRILRFIRDYVGEKKVLIGLSGGIDSTIVCALAIEALGATKVKGLLVRNTRYPSENLIAVRSFAEKQSIELQEIDTALLTQDLFSEYGERTKEEVVASTIDARICDFILRTVSHLENRIYLGTINGTERLTGWYPKGSLVGDICPIGGLLKTQEKELAKAMGLEHLIETISEDSSRICSGCGTLPSFEGVSYETLDTVLFGLETIPKEDIERYFSNKAIPKVATDPIIRRVEEVRHKQEVFPPFPVINHPHG